VPVEQYWSLTVYDFETHALVKNVNRASRASNGAEVKKNADGSVDLYIGPKAPAGQESNWIPTDPARKFEFMFRLYGPSPNSSRRRTGRFRTWRKSRRSETDTGRTPMNVGARFAKWGLGLFIFGVFLTFGIIAHYCAGSRWPNGALFMQNISLWWACPWTLSVAAVQAGGLGMVAIGLTLMLAARVSSTHPSVEGSAALWLCIVGLLGVFAVDYPGYFVFDAIWPSFYYSPVAAGKNAWLLGQAFFIALYFAGTILAFNTVRRALNVVPAAA
jgi:hypothetical protein